MDTTLQMIELTETLETRKAESTENVWSDNICLILLRSTTYYVSCSSLAEEPNLTFEGYFRILDAELGKVQELLRETENNEAPHGYKTLFRQFLKSANSFVDGALSFRYHSYQAREDLARKSLKKVLDSLVNMLLVTKKISAKRREEVIKRFGSLENAKLYLQYLDEINGDHDDE